MEVINKMDTQELMKTSIGTKETQVLNPAKVKIVSVRFQEETKEGKKMDTPLAHFECKHPDRDDLISISKVKYERNGKLDVVGFWVQLDEDKKFKKSSAISALLNYLGCETLGDSYGKEIDTTKQSEDNSYLCLKAY